MGTTGAQGFAAAVAEGQIALRTAVVWNLTSNHYPPLPAALVDTALEAIELANQGIYDTEIDLPEGIEYQGHTFISVYEAVESMHLDSFIDYDEEG